MNDFVFTAFMLGLKDLLDRGFLDKKYSLFEAVDHIDKSLPNGIYSNLKVTNLIRRLGLPKEDM